MNKDIGVTEIAYTTKDVAEMVDIAVPTVRKYAQALEKQSYDFIRDKNDNRLYTQHDAMAIQHLKTLREKTNISVEQAASIVISKHGNRSIRDVAPPDTAEIERYERRYDKDIDIKELKELVGKQNELIENLVSHMEQQQKYTDERLNKRIEETIVNQESVRKAIEKEREILLDAFEKKINDSMQMRDQALTLAIKNAIEKKQDEKKKKSWMNKLFLK